MAVLSHKLEHGRRSVERQMKRRRLERTVKLGALALVRLCRARRLGWEQIGALLRVSVSTLRRWLWGWLTDRLAVQPRGRPLQRAATALRNAVLSALGLLGPGVPIAVLQDVFPATARRELEHLVSRYRRVLRKRGVLLHQLLWANRGAVWAVDFTQAPAPIDACYPYVLSVREVAAGKQLLALPAPDTSAAIATDALRALFVEHGAPLVLKSDNGAAFTASVTRELLRQQGVQHLLSPPGMPSYNGACEAGIGGLRTRAHYLAAQHGRPGHWSCDDVEAARLMANQTARPLGPLGATPDELWAQRLARFDGERTLLHRAVEEATREVRGHFDDPHSSMHSSRTQDAITRIALVRALINCGYLLLRRRRFSHPILSEKVLGIS
jgi:transposase InsO family protein